MPIDMRALGAKHKHPWEELIDRSLTPYQNTCNILDTFLWMPEKEVQQPIAACYLWLNTQWCEETFYLFSYGVSHSGKSTIASIASYMHDIEPLQATSSSKGIRNVINMKRFPLYDPKLPDDVQDWTESDGFLLTWDNVSRETFQDNDLYNMFLSGAERFTDKRVVANKEGGVDVFHTFAVKVFSSVFPIHRLPEFDELKSRCLVMFHEKPKDADFAPPRPKDYNWNGFFEKYYLPVFSDEKIAHEYASFRRKWSYQKFPKCISTDRRSKIADLAATGLIIGAWDTAAKAIAKIGDYFDYLDSRLGGDSEPLVQQLEKLTKDRVSIENKTLGDALQLKFDTGKLLAKPSAKELLTSMLFLGFKLDNGIWVKK